MSVFYLVLENLYSMILNCSKSSIYIKENIICQLSAQTRSMLMEIRIDYNDGSSEMVYLNDSSILVHKSYNNKGVYVISAEAGNYSLTSQFRLNGIIVKF